MTTSAHLRHLRHGTHVLGCFMTNTKIAEQNSLLISLIAGDPVRIRLLAAVQRLQLPDCWVGAGFVRPLIWDHAHDRLPSALAGDLDVVWFDSSRAMSAVDIEIQERLTLAESSFRWSVKNQARMHERNADSPYASTEGAIKHWPETATAVAVRQVAGKVEILAPFGLDDLFSLIVRPTPDFIAEKLPIYQNRVREKRWLERWPRLVVQ